MSKIDYPAMIVLLLGVALLVFAVLAPIHSNAQVCIGIVGFILALTGACKALDE